MPPKLSPTPSYSSNIEIYGDVDSAGLTPRTPYSQAEEGRSRRVGRAIPVNAPITEDEDDGNLDEIDLLQTQSHPLLASSDSASLSFSKSREGGAVTSQWPGRQRLWRVVKDRLIKDRLPLGLIAGSLTALILLLLIVMSVGRPKKLLDYMGVNSTLVALEALDEESQARFNTSTVIDYTAAGYTSYPLTTDQYIQECWKVVKDPKMKGVHHYWEVRPGGNFDVLHKKPTPTSKPCTSSITYLLDGSVGLMADLAHLALIASFAREQNRTLFVSDEHWNRGRWTDHFLPFSQTLPGPEPGCAAPPPDELVACPRTARHWITSARIAFFHTATDFENEFEDPYKYNIERKKPLFDHSAGSFADAIWPSVVNQKLIQSARNELDQLAIEAMNQTADKQYIATHIRRGDRTAMSWRYQKLPTRQMPTSDYVDAVSRTYFRFQNSSSPSVPPLIYLATDSPTAAVEFTDMITTNDTLAQTHGDETARPVVYELRTSTDPELRVLAPEMEYVQEEWGNRTEEERIRETRGIVVDWALMSGAWPHKQNGDATEATDDSAMKPAAVICGLPSNVCKLAAVGLGWDRAFQITDGDPGPDRAWVEIDNAGGIAPIWTAFEIF